VSGVGRRLARGYRTAAIVVLNSLVLLAVAELVLGAVFRARDRPDPATDLYAALDDATLHRIFPDRSRADITDAWREVARPFAYEPFTEFREQQRTGRWVNVDAAGFRVVRDQRPWPPDPARVNVFVFGGSTAFGYGVADAETLASQLQPLLARHGRDVAVYNFARGYYYSTQERILFEQLLTAGFAPAIAVFVDGFNDFRYERDDSAVSPRLAAALEDRGRSPFADWMRSTATWRAVAATRRKLRAPADDTPRDPAAAELSDEAIAHIIARYVANKRLIETASAASDVTPVFVWQPVPMYKYERRYHLFAERGFLGSTGVRRGYEHMARYVRDHSLGADFVWLADVQQDATEPLYVDIVHYAPPFLARLAQLIDEHVGPLIEHRT
jgi:hypothetical protein